MGTYLVHHGVKGMRWGVRRYQNPDGSLTKAGRRHAMKTYDYRKSDAHKNATSGQRARRTNVYNMTKAKFGEKTANKIMYRVDNEGADHAKLVRRETIKRNAIGAGVGLAVGTAYAAYEYGKYTNQLNNAVANQIGKEQGLNTVNGGFAFTAGGVKRGQTVTNRYWEMRVNGFRRSNDYSWMKNRNAPERVMIEQWKNVKYRQL